MLFFSFFSMSFSFARRCSRLDPVARTSCCTARRPPRRWVCGGQSCSRIRTETETEEIFQRKFYSKYAKFQLNSIIFIYLSILYIYIYSLVPKIAPQENMLSCQHVSGTLNSRPDFFRIFNGESSNIAVLSYFRWVLHGFLGPP